MFSELWFFLFKKRDRETDRQFFFAHATEHVELFFLLNRINFHRIYTEPIKVTNCHSWNNAHHLSTNFYSFEHVFILSHSNKINLQLRTFRTLSKIRNEIERNAIVETKKPQTHTLIIDHFKKKTVQSFNFGYMVIQSNPYRVDYDCERF